MLYSKEPPPRRGGRFGCTVSATKVPYLREHSEDGCGTLPTLAAGAVVELNTYLCDALVEEQCRQDEGFCLYIG